MKDKHFILNSQLHIARDLEVLRTNLSHQLNHREKRKKIKQTKYTHGFT